MMKNELLEIIFLNPKSSFLPKLKKSIYANGFKEVKDNETNYRK